MNDQLSAVEAALLKAAEETVASAGWIGERLQGDSLLAAINDWSWVDWPKGWLPNEFGGIWPQLSLESRIVAFLLGAEFQLYAGIPR